MVDFCSTQAFYLLFSVESSMMYVAEYSQEFSTAFLKLDYSVKAVLEKRIIKVLVHPELGKPLHGPSRLYAERFLHYRIIYQIIGTRVRFIRLGKRDRIYRAYTP